MKQPMEHPFPKSKTSSGRYKRLLETVVPEDTLGVVINADPDAIASAMALKRLFWRKIRKTVILNLNPVERADNLSMIKLLRIELVPLEQAEVKKISKWALLDSQPSHNQVFEEYDFDIIVDHHPVSGSYKASFVDIKENYGANSTILTEYLKAAKIRPSSRLATALFYGIKTDTDNFVRECTPNDLNAFRYLYHFANTNIVKKIESSEMTRETLTSYQLAMQKVRFVNNTAFVHMEAVENPDVLVLIADFFMRLAEVTWSVVSGVYDEKLIIIVRNAGFRGDAGKTAKKLFGGWGGTAGGHKTAARAEVPLDKVPTKSKARSGITRAVMDALKSRNGASSR